MLYPALSLSTMVQMFSLSAPLNQIVLGIAAAALFATLGGLTFALTVQRAQQVTEAALATKPVPRHRVSA
jgi:RsiW-degrading membrane proteinase PrsW (M82 family)